ncbi:acylphosphatase [Oribacterium sp. WCC10]|uniref:acylphosphatase n=1 Tax=Oribacterium sp. WCC10 TaxID=1855343 RepID=UPI0008E9F36D|nr:acylphosphatase [Oribacterium sp. WCC10]SFG09730.1 Acylphosphatase [Oribacterium sp. WCC10]
MLFDFLKKYSEQFDITSEKSGIGPDSSSVNKGDSQYRSDSPEVTARKTMIRKHFIFHGSVQGVGFRYTSYHFAESLRLTGWVRNEYDGTVSCEVQGDNASIDEFLQRLNNHRWIRIDHIESDTLDIDPDEKSFRIRG